MHNDADATRRKVFQRWNFSANLHFLDDLILVLALMVRGLVARNWNGFSRLGGSPRDLRSADNVDRVDKFNWAW
jgi:hypothetical protein